MFEKLTVVYTNGRILVMPYVHMNFNAYIKRHPEIARIYKSYANYKGFVYKSVQP